MNTSASDLLTASQRRRGRLMASPALGWFYQNTLSRFDPWLLRRTKGRLSFTPGVPLLLLQTIGAKSGQIRETPLVYAVDGSDVLVVASNGGDAANPGWYYNLRATPHARAILRGGAADYLAHEATGAERERLWPIVVRNNPAYAIYQEQAGERTLPLMVLQPDTEGMV